MNSTAAHSQPKTRTIWIPLILILLVAIGAGFSYRFWSQKTTAQAHSTSESVTTKPVRTGSITLGASGSVTLIPGEETSLAFTVEGTVDELNVSVGDQVKEGQILAQLGNLDELEADVKTAEQDLLSAQQDLAAFQAKAPANLANAQLKVIQAHETAEDAQGSVVDEKTMRCDQDTKDDLLDRYNRAVDQLDELGDGGGNADYYLNILLPQKQRVDQALAAYQACSGFTGYQIASSQADLSLAEAQLKQAQETLDTLAKNSGLDPSQLAVAENKVATAEQVLETAKDNLEGATLTAPFDGTILTVAGKEGDLIEITARNSEVEFITMADLAHPQLTFSVDETDLLMVASGEDALITFDAFPDRTFKGTVTRVNPALTSSDGAPQLTGIIEMDLSEEKELPNFPKNLPGSVQIIQASVEDALLIPLEALHQESDGAYSVYVVGPDGQPSHRSVEIGLSDVASVEIINGLTASDIVITSPVQ